MTEWFSAHDFWHPPDTWHVIERKRLMELLRRAHEGEDPDMLYIEEYANAEHEPIPGAGQDTCG